MILDASTRRNLELTATIRSGSRDGISVGSPRSSHHADGTQAPDQTG